MDIVWTHSGGGEGILYNKAVLIFFSVNSELLEYNLLLLAWYSNKTIYYKVGADPLKQINWKEMCF